MHGIAFHYYRLSLPEIVMDIASFNISRMSSSVQFLPTHLPENRKLLLKKANVLQAQGPESTNIFASCLWQKYLQRPEGLLFDGLTYCEFHSKFRQVYLTQRPRWEPPYDEIPADTKKTYTDRSDPPKFYRAYQGDRGAVIRVRAIPMVDVNDACAHLLMLNIPMRVDCQDWLRVSDRESFFSR